MDARNEGGCPKRSPGLILALTVLKQECDEGRRRDLAEACTGCGRPEAAEGCSAIISHMEAIRQHLEAIDAIVRVRSAQGRSGTDTPT